MSCVDPVPAVLPACLRQQPVATPCWTPLSRCHKLKKCPDLHGRCADRYYYNIRLNNNLDRNEISVSALSYPNATLSSRASVGAARASATPTDSSVAGIPTRIPCERSVPPRHVAGASPRLPCERPVPPRHSAVHTRPSDAAATTREQLAMPNSGSERPTSRNRQALAAQNVGFQSTRLAKLQQEPLWPKNLT